MNSNAFEAKMRAGECYHSLKVPPGAFIVIRVDGRSFSRLTAENGYKKPFDNDFHSWMVETASELHIQLDALYTYTESDEISILLSRESDMFDREVEKLVSIAAGVASSTFTLASKTRAEFDARIWVGPRKQDVVDYFRWRQSDATRCALNGYAHWTLILKDNLSARKASAMLEKATASEKNEILFQHGINFNEMPLWQRRGTSVYWEKYEKEGFNPKKQETVIATRRRVKIDEDLPMKDEYSALVRRFLGST